ncbi:MAG: GDSL-type esterase/lipase family protein [Actinomycetota bacterium]
MTRRTAVIATTVTVLVVAIVAAIVLWPRSPAPTPTASPSIAELSASSTPGDSRPTAVFIGDSYTVGTGTSLSGTGFPAILGELRGWSVQNLAIAGTGYSTGRPDGLCPQSGCTSYVGMLPAAAEANPDIVIVSGGRNDLNRSHLEPAVVTFYTELRRQLPTARLVVTSPLWDDGPTPDELITLREQVEREATRVGAEYIDLGDMFLDRPDLIASDELHPNEEGLALIAQRIHEQMR